MTELSRDVKLDTKALNYLEYRAKAWVAVAAQRLVQTFAPQPSIFSQLRRAVGLRIAERCRYYERERLLRMAS